ncbi:hypothetical protein N0V86_009881 [Didymella sp. IMI 355093]|nr:hypothetical protein N0V86_009881 [Didymella sp. IMI 355093]
MDRPNKLFFTIDGKSRINETTTLTYYMSLSGEGSKILLGDKAAPSQPVAASPQPPAQQPESSAGQQTQPVTEQTKPAAEKPKPVEPDVRIFKVQVTSEATATATLVALPPTTNEGLTKLLDSISTSRLTPGKLPTFSDRSLAALTGNYAATAGTKAYVEPGDMDGNQWNAVLKNNRALTGYFYSWTNAKDKRPVLVKARKPAFNLRGAAPVGEPPANDVSAPQVKIPAIPPFYIEDDATVGITEIHDQFQHTLVKEGFNSFALGGSVSTSTSVSSLVATYNFPRVVIELDPECLELTNECRLDAMRVTDEISKARFFRNYGTIFVSKFTLGGYLHSTRNVTDKEQSTLEQVKDRTRIAAGLSIQTPKASGGLNFAKVDSTGRETGDASLFQDAHLTWNARGGDTLLCSNPPAWASTVKDFKLWRLMNQQRLVTLDGLMKDIDTVAWRKLDQPSIAPPPSGDILKDHEQARVTLIDALIDPDNNAMAQAMRKYYPENKFDQGTNIDKYNDWIKLNFPDDKGSVISTGTVYDALSVDQKIGFGLYMASLKALQVV